MKSIVPTLLFWASAFTSPAQPVSITYHVPGVVPVLKQKDDMACWITVATMMLSWKDSIAYTVDSVAKKLGDPWKLYYELNTGLAQKDQAAFTKKMGLHAEPPANYLPLAYAGLLRQYGPLWIITGDELGAHARLLTGIEEGTNDSTSSFIMIDPLTGKKEQQAFLSFLQEFETEARLANEAEAAKKGSWPELRIQIYHF